MNNIDAENQDEITKLLTLLEKMNKDVEKRQNNLNAATKAVQQKQVNFDNEKELESKLQEIKGVEAWISADKKYKSDQEAEVVRINAELELVTDNAVKRQLKIALKIAETAVNDYTTVISD